MKTIFDVRDSYLGGETLTDDDLNIAKKSLESSKTIERIYASQILLVFSRSTMERQNVIDVVADLYEQAILHSEIVVPDLLNLLQLVPDRTLHDQAVFYRVVVGAMQSDDWEFRVSAVPVLVRYARAGNQEAKLLLAQARQDSHEYVRFNAEHCAK
jgi:hypothetical protein